MPGGGKIRGARATRSVSAVKASGVRRNGTIFPSGNGTRIDTQKPRQTGLACNPPRRPGLNQSFRYESGCPNTHFYSPCIAIAPPIREGIYVVPSPPSSSRFGASGGTNGFTSFLSETTTEAEGVGEAGGVGLMTGASPCPLRNLSSNS